MQLEEDTVWDADTGQLLKVAHNFKSRKDVRERRATVNPQQNRRLNLRAGAVQKLPPQQLSARPWRERVQERLPPDRQRQQAAMAAHLLRQQQAKAKAAEGTKSARRPKSARERPRSSKAAAQGNWRKDEGGAGAGDGFVDVAKLEPDFVVQHRDEYGKALVRTLPLIASPDQSTRLPELP
jgi:hypothetical protein